MNRIYPYKKGSASVRKLKEALNAKIIKLEGSKFRQRATHFVINWGNSHRPDWMVGDDVFNTPEAVALASNKLHAFEQLEEDGVATVPFTDDADNAGEWLEEGHKVFVRHKLTGHSGEGIEVVEHQENPDKEYLVAIADGLYERNLDGLANEVDREIEEMAQEQNVLPEAPLYTRGVANKGEYRVHVMQGEVILYQKKSRKLDNDGEVEVAEGGDADVRNLESGWIYRTGNLRRLERVEELAIDAIESLGLDFGAVDIINDSDNEVHVLEINTAPGLGNEDSLEAYVEGFNRIME